MDYTTTDLAKFGWREKKMAAQLLAAMVEQGLPANFSDDEVTVMMNNSSGFVFLTNSDFQMAMLNRDRLEEWHSCPECGHEGFAEDMRHDGSAGCEEYLRDIGLSVEEEAVAAD
jgi:hypothetical protein